MAQIHGVYILAQNSHGAVLVDMHAAHERIMYERLKCALDGQALAKQELLIPLSFSASPVEMATLGEPETAAVLSQIGLNMSPLGAQEIAIRSVPALIKQADAIELARAVLADIAELGASQVLTERRNELLGTLALYMEATGTEKLQAATQIMIMPGFTYRLTSGMITNFHQPKSTLLLLVSAFIGEEWRRLYDYALSHGFRFLSYGDSSLLLP